MGSRSGVSRGYKCAAENSEKLSLSLSHLKIGKIHSSVKNVARRIYATFLRRFVTRTYLIINGLFVFYSVRSPPPPALRSRGDGF